MHIYANRAYLQLFGYEDAEELEGMPMIDLIGVDEATDLHGLGRYPDGRLNGWFIETAAVGRAFRPVAIEVYRPGFGREAVDRMGAVAKGAGMIRPDMATMLCFVCTDAWVPAAALDRIVATTARHWLSATTKPRQG